MSMGDKYERAVIALDGDENDHLHATWSRSGKRLIVTVSRRGASAQVELTPTQVAELGTFLAESNDDR
ncbi:MAG: hypothetical protein ACRDKE_02460 [Solirubrobacterales bacterium]